MVLPISRTGAGIPVLRQAEMYKSITKAILRPLWASWSGRVISDNRFSVPHQRRASASTACRARASFWAFGAVPRLASKAMGDLGQGRRLL